MFMIKTISLYSVNPSQIDKQKKEHRIKHCAEIKKDATSNVARSVLNHLNYEEHQ